jgi:hypothetical protein
MLVILGTQEAEIRRIAVRSQPGQAAGPYLRKIPPPKSEFKTLY